MFEFIQNYMLQKILFKRKNSASCSLQRRWLLVLQKPDMSPSQCLLSAANSLFLLLFTLLPIQTNNPHHDDRKYFFKTHLLAHLGSMLPAVEGVPAVMLGVLLGGSRGHLGRVAEERGEEKHHHWAIEGEKWTQKQSLRDSFHFFFSQHYSLLQSWAEPCV